MIDVTCALIVDDQNRLFAAQRSSVMSLPLKWELPGGKVESTEFPDECSVTDNHHIIKFNKNRYFYDYLKLF